MAEKDKDLTSYDSTHMLHCVWRPAPHSPVAPIAARILSSNTGERRPRMNVECGNSYMAELMSL